MIRLLVYRCLAVALGVGLAACHRTTVAPAADNSDLVGEWQLVATSGGWAGTTTPASTGTAERLLLRPNSTYERRITRQGAPQVLEGGTYTLGTTQSIYTGKPAKTLLLGQQATPYVITELSSRDLVLSDNIYDGHDYHYQR